MLLLHKLKLKALSVPSALYGPSIKNAKVHQFALDGTNISILFPRQSSASNIETITPLKEYDLSRLAVKPLDSLKAGWYGEICARSLWDFYGPKFTGIQATLTMSISVITPKDISSGSSLFHPRSFEYMIGKLLQFDYSDLDLDHRQLWTTPINWHPVTKLKSVCASFDVHPTNARHVEVTMLLLPISDHSFLQVNFRSNWNILADENDNAYPNQRDWLDRKAMRQLIDDIIDSVKVDFSENAQYQQKEALKGLDDTSLCEHYPPIDFSRAKVSHPQSSASLARQIDE